MPSKVIQKIVLIGAGNVGHHLGRHLVENGFDVIQVYSRRKRKAQQLAKTLGAAACNNLAETPAGADLYLIAVKDNAIAKVAGALAKIQGIEAALAVHTSGATPSKILQPFFRRYGVLYPLQTFSIARPVDMETVPLCIDARYAPDRRQLIRLGKKLSAKVFRVGDQQREVLHVAAVFGNNFSNLMYTIGADLLADNNLSFDLLRPLILETAAKVQGRMPAQMQTGPALRRDDNTLNRHLDYLLSHYPDYGELYLRLTRTLYPGFTYTPHKKK